MSLANWLNALKGKASYVAPDPNKVLNDVTGLMNDLQIAYGPGYTPSKATLKVSNYAVGPGQTAADINIGSLMMAAYGIPANQFNGTIDLIIAVATGSAGSGGYPCTVPLVFDDPSGNKFLWPTTRGSSNNCTLNITFDYSAVAGQPVVTPAARQWDYQFVVKYKGGATLTAIPPIMGVSNGLGGFVSARLALSFQHASTATYQSFINGSTQCTAGDAYALAGEVQNIWSANEVFGPNPVAPQAAPSQTYMAPPYTERSAALPNNKFVCHY